MSIGNDFITHLKYASCLAKLSQGLTFSLSTSLKPPIPNIGMLKNKLNLVKLMKKSLCHEYEIVTIDKNYSAAAVLWLPTKTYYLLYHQLSVLDCILTGDEKPLRIKHGECLKKFANRIKACELRFSHPLLNNVFDKDILEFKENRPGEHLSHKASDEFIFKRLMKLTGKYNLKEFKRNAKIKQLRTKQDKAKYKKYLDCDFRISVFDFFYSMRIKSTCREFNFINSIPSAQTKVYFEQYLKASQNICKSVQDLVSALCPDFAVDGC